MLVMAGNASVGRASKELETNTTFHKLKNGEIEKVWELKAWRLYTVSYLL